MFNPLLLFNERLSKHFKETSRYLRYIFNGHTAIAMFFLVSAISIYYQQGLQHLPENFPTAWLIGIILGIMVTFIPVRTFLQEPDIVFLMPAEHKMGPFFRKALFYSYIVYAFFMVFLIAALSPLYFHSFPEQRGIDFLLLIIVVFIFQGWNLSVNWWMLKVRDMRRRRIDQITRLVVNVVAFYFMFQGHLLYAAIATVIMIGLFLYAYRIGHQSKGIAWEDLISRDRYRMQFFYQIANMFTEVPHVKSKVKKRNWLVNLIANVPFQNKYTYAYLYRITFVRSGDYFGMYLRLIIIGALLIYFVPNEWLKIIFALLFLYLSSFQMVALTFHYRTNIWPDLYPVDKQNQQKSLSALFFQLAVIQTIIYSIIFLLIGNYLFAALTLIVGSIFSSLFTNYYVKAKLKKML